MPKPGKLTQPCKLKKGDQVGVVAPAGVVDPHQLEKGLRVLERMGLQPVLGKHVFSRHRFLAGADKDRAADVMSMFKNSRVKGIVCARGGYGVNRILSYLNSGIIKKNPKVFVGASDITLLLLYLSQRCSLITFHGPMVAGNFGCHPMNKSKKQFQQLLTGQRSGRKIISPQARVFRPGKAQGRMTGGCLTLLCRSLKTPYEVKTRGKILLIEDVNEPIYRIDGMLWQLKKAGKFREVQGIVFGEMVNCHPRGGRNGSFEDILRDVFAGSSFPILTNCPMGHGKEMWTIPFGIEARLDTGSKTIEFDNNGVV